jgi:Protein of unknown function (DUF4232)
VLFIDKAAVRGLAAFGTVLLAAAVSAGCASSSAGPGGGAVPTEEGSNPTASASASPASTDAAAGGAGASASPGTGGSAANSSTRCHTADLSGSFTGVPGSAAAGSISYNLKLTNTSKRTCTIYGFAGMQLLDAKHAPLPTKVQWNALAPKRLITLKPGASAAATDRFSPDVPGTGDNMTPGAACEPTAAFTEITPPDETTQLVATASPPTSVCERGTMSLTAFVAGAKGPNQ